MKDQIFVHGLCDWVSHIGEQSSRAITQQLYASVDTDWLALYCIDKDCYFLKKLAKPPGCWDVVLEALLLEPELLHLQRSWSGTPARACSICIPHPAQVALGKYNLKIKLITQNNDKINRPWQGHLDIFYLLSTFTAWNFSAHFIVPGYNILK